MTERKPLVTEKESSKETETVAKKRKKSMIVSKSSRRVSDLAPASPADIWQAFDDTLQGRN